MAEYISWFATGATILAATVTASNLGARITGFGFIIFLFGSIAWFSVGALTAQPALLWTNAALTMLNLWGIWRWLGRQARLEQGSEAAAEASAETPGESLFPASILTHSKVIDDEGKEIGLAVDAMIGATSGRIRYLMVSSGGVGGVGERLKRVDWRQACFDQDALKLAIDGRRFERLPDVARDHWPGQ